MLTGILGKQEKLKKESNKESDGRHHRPQIPSIVLLWDLFWESHHSSPGSSRFPTWRPASPLRCRCVVEPQGPEEMCLSLEHQNPWKTSEKMGYFDRVIRYTFYRPQTQRLRARKICFLLQPELVNIRRKALLSSVGFRKRITSRSPRS